MLAQAKEFEGCLPQPQNLVSQGERLHQVYQRARMELDNIMAGYILPDPYFTTRALATVERLMNCLKDPSLPLLELQVGWFHTYFKGEWGGGCVLWDPYFSTMAPPMVERW